MPRPKGPTPLQKSFRNWQPPLKTRGVFANVKLEPVPFDPAIDCLPYACFNCRIVDVHLSKDCTKSVVHEFCVNCGRRGLDVRECPRCSKGYTEVFGQKSFLRVETKQSIEEAPKKTEKKLPVGMTPFPKPTKKKKAKKLSSQSSELSFEKNTVMEKQQFNSTSDSATASELRDEFFISDNDEDLDHIIFDEGLDGIVVDESEILSLQPQTSNVFQAFVSLMDIMKHLPIDTQHKIVMQFVEEQKMLAGQR